MSLTITTKKDSYLKERAIVIKVVVEIDFKVKICNVNLLAFFAAISFASRRVPIRRNTTLKVLNHPENRFFSHSICQSV